MSKGSARAVVIGSGFGGLAAAVRLGARGYRVTVLEAASRPGGRAQQFEQDGFVFDAGPTVVTAPQLLEELWELAGRRLADDVTLLAVDPYYRIRFADGTGLDYVGDPARMLAALEARWPGDAGGYTRFMAASREVFDLGFTKLAHVPFGHPSDMLRVLPAMVRLGSYRSVYDMVSRYVRSEQLRQVMSFHTLLVGGSPFSTSSIYTLIPALERAYGVHFPVGGVGALVRGLARLIEQQGGEVRTSTAAEEIVIEARRAVGVRTKGGELLPADIVVSNADPLTTYGQLLRALPRRRWTDARIARTRLSMGLFVWYFGTRRRYEDVAQHTILLGARYRELLHDIFERKLLPEDFSLYLHRSTAADPGLAPEGCDAFYVLSPVPHLPHGRSHGRGSSATDWNAMGGPYRQRIAAFLAEAVLPGLEEVLATSQIATPLTFRDELGSPGGAGFSLEPRLTQSAYFRPHNASEEVEGLYLVGAGTHPGAGLPGVLSSARALDGLVPDARAR
jgi:phytoene desaturase